MSSKRSVEREMMFFLLHITTFTYPSSPPSKKPAKYIPTLGMYLSQATSHLTTASGSLWRVCVVLLDSVPCHTIYGRYLIYILHVQLQGPKRAADTMRFLLSPGAGPGPSSRANCRRGKETSQLRLKSFSWLGVLAMKGRASS